MDYNKKLQAFQKKAFYVSPTNGLEIQKKSGGRTHLIYPYSSENIYNVHNHIVYWQNCVGGFIHPSVDGLEEVLKKAGYRKDNISVPCSHKEKPVNCDVWSMMLSYAEQERREHFLEECMKNANKKNLKPLPENFLWNYSFEIPLSGIEATHWNKTIRIYPYAHIMLDYIPILVGLCNAVNGYLSFVDNYGRMFVTVNNAKNLLLLTEAGYVMDNSIPVPFSNGETPTAMLSRCKWETVCGNTQT